MRPGLLAFASTCVFFGAALYINIVEQPSRLALDARPIIREWILSNRRGFVLLAVLAIISSLAGYADYILSGDVRWLIGASIILSSLPYAYFVVTPVNILLYGLRRKAPSSTVGKLMRDWGVAEWGQTAIGLAACCVYGWPIGAPP